MNLSRRKVGLLFGSGALISITGCLGSSNTTDEVTNETDNDTAVTNGSENTQEYHLDINTSDGNSIRADHICISAKNSSYQECSSSVSEVSFKVPGNGYYLINVSHDAYETVNATTYIWEDGQKGTVHMNRNNSTKDNSTEEEWVS